MDFAAKLAGALWNQIKDLYNLYLMLLGMGKKVYLRPGTSHYLAMKELGISVFDFECIDLSPLPLSDRMRNKSIIMSEFSKQKLLSQLGLIFDSK